MKKEYYCSFWIPANILLRCDLKIQRKVGRQKFVWHEILYLSIIKRKVGRHKLSSVKLAVKNLFDVKYYFKVFSVKSAVDKMSSVKLAVKNLFDVK